MSKPTIALALGVLALLTALCGSYLVHTYLHVPETIAESSATMRKTDSMRLTMKVALMSQRGFEAYLFAVHTQEPEQLIKAINFTKASLGFAFSRFIDNDALIEQAVPRIRENVALMERAGLTASDDQLARLSANAQDIFRLTEEIEKDIWVSFQAEFIEFQTLENRQLLLSQFMLLAALAVAVIAVAVFARQRRLTRDLQRTEKGLRESEQLLRDAQAMARIGNWDENLVDGVSRWSDEEYRLIGFEPGAVVPSRDTFMKTVHPDDRRDVANTIRERVEAGDTTPYAFVHRVVTPEGVRYLEQKGQLELGDDGMPARLFGTSSDVTERRNAELELERYRDRLEVLVEERTRDLAKEVSDRRKVQDNLRVSEMRLRQILDSSSAGISILRVSPIKRIYANRPFLEFFQARNAGELDAMGFKNTFVLEADFETATACVESGKGFRRFVMERRRVDGSTWWGLHDAIPITFEDAPATIVWHYDITDQKIAEREMVQTEKLASLGSMVAGLAHEVNTPIGVGLTAASFLEEQAQSVSSAVEAGELSRGGLDAFLDAARQSSAIILSNLQRASGLVGSFKQISVDQSSDELRSFNLYDYVEETLQSLLPQLKMTSHEIEVTGDREIVMSSYPGALSQILTNLVMNSLIHAFEDDDSGHIRIETTLEGNKAHLRYSDDGKGVPPEVLKRIFDPFFTTRRGRGGSGLGMHIVYNLTIRKLGGTVVCDSRPGEGITVLLTLPLDVAVTQDKT